MRFWPRRDRWEGHICSPPGWLQILEKGGNPAFAPGQVWQCRCGRRFLLHHWEDRQARYSELTHSDDIDDVMDEIEQFENSESPQ